MKATKTSTVVAVLSTAVAVLGGCSPRDVPLACDTAADSATLAARASPYDSVTVPVGSHEAKVCYSRPFVRGRRIFGDLIPYDTLWRTGANEPTIIHLPFAAAIAGIDTPPGKYSIYTVPGETTWRVIVNASTEQWGITRREVGAAGNVFESAYTDAVRTRELGRARINTAVIDSVEQLAMRVEVRSETHTDLLVEWETTRLIIPIRLPASDR